MTTIDRFLQQVFQKRELEEMRPRVKLSQSGLELVISDEGNVDIIHGQEVVLKVARDDLGRLSLWLKELLK